MMENKAVEENLKGLKTVLPSTYKKLAACLEEQ